LVDTRWLKRLRRELSASGRRSQLAWQLSRQDGRPHEEWRGLLQAITSGESRPDPDLILRLEGLLARPQSEAAAAADQSLFLFAGE
jgi:hypothetical protein